MVKVTAVKHTFRILIGIASCCVLYVTLKSMVPGAFELDTQTFVKMANHVKPPIQTCLPANDHDATMKTEEICNEFTQYSNMIQPLTVTSLLDWSFKTTVKCPAFEIDRYPTKRIKVVLECNGTVGRLVKTLTNSSQDISVIDFGNKCLEDAIKKCCYGSKLVPNVMNYVWFYKKDIDFFQFISLMSTIRFIKPCLILIHGPSLPTGRYWDYIVSLSPNIILVKREPPTTIFGKKLAFKQHSSDIMRMEAVMNYGGMFMDFDQVVLRPIELLRQYPHTQGIEEPGALACQFIMAKPNSSFLQRWYDGYRTTFKTKWTWNSQLYPYKLSQRRPDLIHVEGYNFTKPNWQNRDQIHKGNYDWSTNYGMHMSSRSSESTIDLKTIRRLKTTVGSVSRHILFGNKEVCET